MSVASQSVDPGIADGLALCSTSAQHFYPHGPGVATFMCGPVGLLEDAALPALVGLGFEDGRSIFSF